MSRPMLNCWLVAMWIWGVGHCRQYAWVRRSHSFRGLIPHFGFAERAGWRYMRTVEYVPPSRRRWTRRDCVILFDGHYVVRHFRLLSIRRWATKEQALADLYLGNGRI